MLLTAYILFIDMKNDTRNKRRRRRPVARAMSSKTQEEFQDDPVVIAEEPKGPVFDDSTAEQNIYEKIERSKNNGWSANVRSFFGSNGGILLPIGVLAIAIVLAFGAIQILEDNDQQGVNIVTTETEEKDDKDATEEPDKNTPSTSDNPDTPDNKEDKIPDPVPPEAPEIPDTTSPATPEPETPKHIQEPIVANAERETLRQQIVERTNSGIQVVALVGEGITHLARKAVMNQLDYKKLSLNDEQLVYAEDHLQNRTGDHWLEVGQILEFHYTDVDTSIESAQQLQDWQIQNLMQYTQ